MEQELTINYDRLERINKGHNFLNFKQTEKSRYYVRVMLEATQNLKSKEEQIVVKSNFSFLDFEYRWEGVSVDDFLKELTAYSKKPLAIFRTSNRKEKVSSWNLRGIEKAIRTKKIEFKDIEITIGILAEKKLRFDFKDKVKEILKEQKKSNKQEQELVDRFIRLREKVLLLKNLIGKKQNSWNSYGEAKDDSIKIQLTDSEYDEQLKVIELELRKIGKKFNITDVGEFDYKEQEQEEQDEQDNDYY